MHLNFRDCKCLHKYDHHSSKFFKRCLEYNCNCQEYSPLLTSRLVVEDKN